MISSRFSRAAVAIAALAGLAALAGCSSSTPADAAADVDVPDGWPDTITFAHIPSESDAGITESSETTIKALEKELGVKVETQEATSYAAVIEALRAGQVDIGSMGPFSYVVAKDGDAGVVPAAAVADSADAAASYQSYGIVPADSDITSLADFKGKKVCFVDPTSTSGYLFPSAGLLEAGVDPVKDVTPVMAGGHDASALSVADGTCDAGFAFDTMVDSQLIESGQLKKGALKTIWKSEDIPNSPVVVSTKLPDDLQKKIIDVFQNDINKPALVTSGICSSEDDCVLPDDSKYGYIPVEDSLYDGIRAVCDITKSESCVA